MSDLQYARETEAMLAQQRKENRSNMFILCPHVQVIFAYCFFSFYIIHYIVGHFTFWISLLLRILLSPKFGSRPKIGQKVKSFSLSDSLRPNFGLSDR